MRKQELLEIVVMTGHWSREFGPPEVGGEAIWQRRGGANRARDNVGKFGGMRSR
jgi:hypothetical protein